MNINKKDSLRNKIFCAFMIFVLVVSYMPSSSWAAYADESKNQHTEESSDGEGNGQTLPTTPGSTISGEYDVTKDTSIVATTAGQSALIVDGNNTVINIAKGVTLTVQGANGDHAIGGGAGIWVPSGKKLTIKGEGVLAASGGNGGSPMTGGDGERGSAEFHFWGECDGTSGKAGDGGAGGGGVGAAIGTPGSNGANGGPGGGRVSGQNEEKSGKAGTAGSNASNSGDAGVVIIGSKVTIGTSSGKQIVNHYRGIAGYNEWDDWGMLSSVTGAGGAGGGTGGPGGNGPIISVPTLNGNELQLAIGSGGAGGGGGGGGASGTVKIMAGDKEIASPGGGGGAGHGGGGTKADASYGGMAAITLNYSTPAQNGGSGFYEEGAADLYKGGKPAYGPADGDNTFGGQGGDGGFYGSSGLGGAIYTSQFPSAPSISVSAEHGKTAAIYQVFSIDECEIVAEDPDNPDGESYKWTEEGRELRFVIKHKPSGTIVPNSAFTSQIVYEDPVNKLGKATLKITGVAPNTNGPALVDSSMMAAGSMTKEYEIRYAGSLSGIETDNAEYNGKPYTPTINEPVVTLEDGKGTIIDNPNLVYTYKKRVENGYEELNEAPKDAGYYILVVTADPGEDYSVWQEYRFSINTLVCEYDSAMTENRTFSPGDKSVNITSVDFSGLVEGDELVFGKDYKVAKARMDDPNAGEGKKVTFDLTMLNQNYVFENASSEEVKTITVTTTVDIYKKIVPLPSASGTTFVYNGTEQTYDVPGITNLYTVAGNKGTNVGEYTAIYDLVDKENTCWDGQFIDAVSIDWKIEKATAPVIEAENVYYQAVDSGEKTYKLKLQNVPVGFKEGLSFEANGKDDPDNIIDDWTVSDDGTATFTINEGKTVGNAADLAYTAKSNNYLDTAGLLHVELVGEKIGVLFSGVSVNSKEYDGKPIQPTGTLAVTDNEGTPITDITPRDIDYNYYKASGEKLAGPPAEVGDYYLVIATDPGSKYVGSTENMGFSITKKEISVTSATGINRAYEKDNKLVNIGTILFSDGVILKRGTDYTVTQGTMADDKVGVDKEATFEISLINEGYSFAGGSAETEMSVLVTISPLEVKIPKVEDITFDGSAHTPIAETELYTASGQLSGRDVAEYATILELKDKQNTKWEDNTTDDQTVNWKICKGTHLFDKESVVYAVAETGEKAYSFKASLPVGMDVGLNYSLQSYKAGNVLSGAPSVDETTGRVTYTLNESKKVKDSASVTVRIKSTNYEDAFITLNIEIVSKKEVKISGGSIESKEQYDGMPVEPSIDDLTITSDGKDVKPEIIEAGHLEYNYYKEVSGQMVLQGNTAPKDAGNYQLVFSISADDDFYTGESEPISFTIGKRLLTATAGDDVYVSKVYDGTKSAAGHYHGALDVQGVLPAEEDLVTVNAETPDFESVNCHKITRTVGLYIVGDSESNYELSNTTITIPYEITQRTISIANVTCDNRKFIEGDKSVNISDVTFSNAVTGEKVDYVVLSAVSQSEYVGKQDVDYEIKLNNGNYKFENGETQQGKTSITITKANGQNFGKQSVVNYSDQETGEREYSIDSTSFPDGMKKGTTYSMGELDDPNKIIGEWSVEAETGEVLFTLNGGQVGNTATFNVKIGSDNYEESSISFGVTLIVKDQATITGATADSKTYDTRANEVDTTNVVITDSQGNDITSLIKDAGHLKTNYYKIGSSKPLVSAPTMAGNYTWEVFISYEDNSYMGSQVGEFTISPQVASADASEFKYVKKYDGTKGINGSEGKISLSNIYEGDNVYLMVRDAGYESPNVQDGNLSKSVYLGGSSAANYTLDSATLDIHHIITPAEISLKNAKAVDRKYIYNDKDVEIESVEFDGLPTEEVPEYDASGVMTNDAVGEGKSVSYTASLRDSNYIFTNGTDEAQGETTVNISKADSKEYNVELEEYSYAKTGDFEHVLTFDNPPDGIDVTGTWLLTPQYTTQGVTDVSYDPETKTISYHLTGKAKELEEQDIKVIVESSNYEDCSVILKIHFANKKSINITNVKMSGKTYDKTEIADPNIDNVVVTDESGAQVEIPKEDFNFAYYEDMATEEHELSSPPTDAGTYFVVPWVENEEYIGRCEPIKFDISQAEVEVSAGTLRSSKAYDGAQTPNYSGEFEVKGIIGDDQSKVNVILNDESFGPNVGEGSKDIGISIEGDRAFNYKLKDNFISSVPFEITPKEISIDSANAQNRVYEYGNKDVKILDVDFSGVVAGEELAYKVSKATMEDDNAGTEKDVTFTVLLPDTSNYRFENGKLEATGKTTANIRKQKGIDYGTQQDYLVYTVKGEQTYDFGLGHPSGMSVGMEYAIKGTIEDPDNIMDGVKIDSNNNLVYTAQGGEIGNSAIVPVTISSTNFEDSTVSYQLILTDKRQTSISGLSFGTHTYDKTPSPVLGKLSIMYGNKDVTSEIDEKDILYNYYKNGQLLGGAPVDAGDYQMQVVISDNELIYVGQSKMIPFTITKAPLEVETGTVNVTKIYDGTMKPFPEGNLKVTGIVSGDEGSVSVNPNISDYSIKDVHSAMKTLGLTVTGAAVDNYSLSNSTVEVPYTITPKTVSVGEVTTQGRAYENGNLAVKINDVLFNDVIPGEKPGYEVQDGVGYMENDMAGTGKTVRGAVTIKDGNYTFDNLATTSPFETTVNIAKASAVSVDGEQDNRAYSQTRTYVHEFNLTLPPGMDDGVKYKIEGVPKDPFEIIKDYSIDETTGKLTYTVDSGFPGVWALIPVMIESTNYEDSNTSLVVQLVDKTDVTISGMWIDDKTYDGKVAPLKGKFKARAGAEDVTDQFKPEDISYKYYKIVGGDRQELTQAPTNAGKYELEVHAETEIYEGTVTYPYEITQREITIEGQTINAKVGDEAPDLNTYDKVKIYKVTGLVDGEPLVKEPVATYEKTPDMSKAGEYAIKLNGTEVTENYVVAKVTDGKLVVSSGEGPNPDGPGGGINTGDDTMAILFAGLGICIGTIAILLRRCAKY